MARAAFEYALSAEAADERFARRADRQYTRELLFSQLVDLMGLVVCRLQPSLNAAIRKRAIDLGGTRKAVYAKIARTEPGLGAAARVRRSGPGRRSVPGRWLPSITRIRNPGIGPASPVPRAAATEASRPAG